MTPETIRRRSPPWAADVLIGATLLAVALLLRWPRLMLLPAFSDESFEGRWALDIARGHHLPLTTHPLYCGPLFAYMLAAAFRLFGEHLPTARAVVMVFGALTAPATFWLGRLLAGRTAGAIAGALVAVSPALILYSSHYGWSNSLTPFFATVATASLYHGVEKRSQTALAVGGFLVALTLQTHPISALSLAGLACWLLWRRLHASWPSSRALIITAIAFVIGYAPMIVANVVRPATSLRAAAQRSYVVAPTLDVTTYASRAADLSLTVVDMVAGGLAAERFPAAVAVRLLTALLLLLVLWHDWRRGSRLLASVLLPTLLLLPAGTKLFMPRYVTFLLPIAFVGVASLVVPWLQSAESARGRPRWRAIAAGVAVAVTLFASWRLLERYSDFALAEGLSNKPFFDLRETLAARGACGPRLLVEEPGRPLVHASWVGLYAVDQVLALTGCPHEFRTHEASRDWPGDAAGAWVVLSAHSVPVYETRWHLEPVFTFDATAGFDRMPLALYRISPHPIGASAAGTTTEAR